MELYYTMLTWGNDRFYIAATEKGLSYLCVSKQDIHDLKEWQDKYLPEAVLVEDELKMAKYKRNIKQYLQGKTTTFSIPLDLYGTEFQKEVWHALLGIPYGKTTNYTHIAIQINKRNATRAVANAIGKNPILFVIPCHRVIRKDGSLSGFSAGIPLKRQLLQLENSDQDVTL